MKSRLAFVTHTYNSENYLHKAIESVLEQSFVDFTYYIADDCSTDTTKSIIEKYAAIDDRIVPFFAEKNDIHRIYAMQLENIMVTDHEFLCYLDHDDWYEPTFAENMIHYLDNYDIDLAVCASNFISEKTGQVAGRRPDFTQLIKSDEYGRYFSYMHVFLRPVWGKIFRLSILRNHEIKFRTDMTIGADTLFVLEFVKKAKGIYIYGEILHNYLVLADSNSRTHSSKAFISDIKQSRYTKQWLVEMKADTTQNKEFLANVFLHATNDTSRVIFSSNLDLNKKVELYRYIYTHSETIESFELLETLEDPHRKQTLQQMKGGILNTFFQLDTKEYIQQFYDVFCAVICPAIKEYITAVQLAELASNKDKSPLLQLAKGNYNLISRTICQKPDDEIYKQIAKLLIDKDQIMSAILDKEALIAWPNIVDLVYRKMDEVAGEDIYDIIMTNFDTNPESTFALADLLQYIAALNRDSEKFITAKMVLLRIYFERNDKEMFEVIASDIESMLPNDPVVAQMRSIFGLTKGSML